jgi:DNA-binding transcriptional LysR family regulator
MSDSGSIPSIQALRVLEAAVRYESYSRAAEQLGLTHGAVSRQIDSLEQLVGRPLFVRTQGKMVPTESARVVMTQARQALAILEAAFGANAEPGPAPLRITTTQAIARLWLIPRLERIESELPNTVGSVLASTEPTTDWSSADIAIRYGTGRWPSVNVTLLSKEAQFPVAHKSLLKRYRKWQDAPLIRSTYQNWRAWFDVADLMPPTHVDDGLLVADTSLALDAALCGRGIALARGRLVQPFLDAGYLVRVCKNEAQDHSSYFLVRPTSTEAHPGFAPLRDWLQREFATPARLTRKR